jgi:hypothetical protein
MYQSVVKCLGGVTYGTPCKQHMRIGLEETEDLKLTSGSSDKNSSCTYSVGEPVRIALDKMEGRNSIWNAHMLQTRSFNLCTACLIGFDIHLLLIHIFPEIFFPC